MTTKKIIIGNWKMAPEGLEKAREIFLSVESGLKKSSRTSVVICPSFVHLAPLAAQPKRKAFLGAQNMFVEEKGSYTGEVSAAMIKDAGAEYVILGHSSCRNRGETDETVNAKVHLALKAGLTPVVCVGEEARDEEGHYLSFMKNQVEKALKDVPKKQLASLIIAYEPVFAVGASAAMGAREVREMNIFIKKTLVDAYKMKNSVMPKIIYGGSVDRENANNILEEGDVDGLLIGRQSLDPKNFIEIISRV